MITAELDYTLPKKDSLVVSVNLQNHTSKPLFLVCKATQLETDTTIPIVVNYHFSPEEEFEYLRRKSMDFLEMNNERSSVKDTFYITLPRVNIKYQNISKGHGVNVYERIDNLRGAYYILGRNKLAPNPPNDETYFYTDVDVYNLVRAENINDQETTFYEEVIILKPNQIKTFSINMSYLLLQKATYFLSFDYETNDSIFQEEAKILNVLGFNRFKGHIVSNIVEVKSTGDTFGNSH